MITICTKVARLGKVGQSWAKLGMPKNARLFSRLFSAPVGERLQAGAQRVELERADREQVELADIAHGGPADLACAFEHFEGAEVAVQGFGVLAGFPDALRAIRIGGSAAVRGQVGGTRLSGRLCGCRIIARQFGPAPAGGELRAGQFA